MPVHLTLLAAAVAAGAAPVLVAPTTVDVPHNGGEQQVVVLERTFEVGGGSGWHTHSGIEIGHVVSGVTEMRLADGTVERYAAGETFVIPRGAVHEGVNAGDVPVRLVITYLIDKGSPLRTPAAAPVR